MKPHPIKADFHMHTRFSPDSQTAPQRLVARCQERGLNLVAVTDHNTIAGAHAVARIAPFPVIIGAEVKTADGDLIGLFLQEEVPKGLSAVETAKRIKAQGGLVFLPHPYDTVRRSVMRKSVLPDLLPLVDAVEGFNARNVFSGANTRALTLAREHRKPIVAVSDAHHPLEIGKTYTLLPFYEGTPESLLMALREAVLVCRPSSPLVHGLTVWSKVLRRLGVA
ncbi:MAG: PHP domain-containing protein [Dehalococcoidia bacterium]|nr:PHP domain-containing protein [Dehalococcoidia bacterium]MDW8119180.1 PHP domain-containing protein [Chloroflexota bacterium]